MSGRNLLDGLLAEAKARIRNRAQPKWVAPMLATLTDEVFSRQGWLFEPKWDGERCLAFRSGRDLNLFSRNRIRLNAKYPEVIEAIQFRKVPVWFYFFDLLIWPATTSGRLRCRHRERPFRSLRSYRPQSEGNQGRKTDKAPAW